ncbi:ribosomal maturation YjgA family protein [Paenibacillus wenxiniae]|uniref:DUF2809 domain-containing protein n=1 Tax=Paenibacillus wenxiniae TaxID=1636843 RepID=A0ABW4RPT2_9BACL
MNKEDRPHLQHDRPHASRTATQKTERHSTCSPEHTMFLNHTESISTYAASASNKHSIRKYRFGYAIAIIVTIGLGLASRRYAEMLPPLFAAHAGDMLWAMMVYWGVRLLLYRRYWIAAIAALLFCYGIECSQLYQADWIRQLRDTTIGGLVLGHGFLVVDLVRYTVGVGLAVIIDRLARYSVKQ